MGFGLTMQSFIDDNRPEIDTLILACVGKIQTPLDDEERELFILNYEPLYLLATQAGVNV